MVRLWLVRHFEPEVAPGTCYGQTDLGLRQETAEPSRCLLALRDQLADLGASAVPVFSSPLQRCAQIAIHLNADAEFDDRLRELDFGNWEMQPWEAIGAEDLDAWANDLAGFRPPEGETAYELQRRVLQWLQELACQHETAVVITHAGVMRVLQAHHQRLPSAKWLDLRYDYGQVLALEWTPEQIHAAPVQ